MGWFAYDLQMFAQWDNLFFGFTTVYQGFFFKQNWEPEQASTQYYIVA